MDALAKAVNYLNIKPRTREQVEKYLKGKGFGADEIEKAVSELEEYNYIDDLNYAVMYFQLGFEKGRGVSRIRRELAEKGVDRETIDAAYYELEDVPDQYDAAMEIAMSVAGGCDTEEMTYEEKTKLRAKIARRLGSRGYSGDIAYRAAKECVK